MIVEITGVPGSGKTSIYRETIQNEFKDITFIENKFNIFYEFYLFLYFFMNIKSTYKYLFLIQTILHSNNTFIHKLNILRNTIKKISKYMRYQNKKELIVFDEGVSHIPFNLFVDSNSSALNSKQIDELIKILPKADKLIVIETNRNIVLERLKNRGHKRMNLENETKTNIFINKSFKVQEHIKLNYANDKLICIQNDDDLSIVLKTFEKKLKEINV